MVNIKEKYGVIYIWFDRKHKRYYIGSHWGKNPENDNYICSSNWMRDAYRRRSQDFKRRIISRIYTTKQDLLNKELEWFSLIKPEEIRIRYYNLRINHTYHWSTSENALSVAEKISFSKKGKPNGRKGSVFSEEHKAKISIGQTGRKHSEATKTKMSDAKKGRIVSEETRLKLSEAAKGRTCSEATKKKMSDAKKGIVFSEEHKSKLSASRKGKFHSEETKSKMSVSNTGRTQSKEIIEERAKKCKGKKRTEETKLRMSESAKNRWNKNIIIENDFLVDNFMEGV